MTTLFIFEAESCKNFKAVFLKTLFFNSSTSNTYISESFVLRRFGEVLIDPKFYLVLGSGNTSKVGPFYMLLFYSLFKVEFNIDHFILRGHQSASENYQVFEISNHSCYFSM